MLDAPFRHGVKLMSRVVNNGVIARRLKEIEVGVCDEA